MVEGLLADYAKCVSDDSSPLCRRRSPRNGDLMAPVNIYCTSIHAGGSFPCHKMAL